MQDTLSRTFSSATTDALTRAIRQYDPQSAEAEQALKLQVVRAVGEARSRGWRPEELTAALRATVPESELPPGIPEQVYQVVRRSALVAYFGSQMSAF
jgi:hypothetical protein